MKKNTIAISLLLICLLYNGFCCLAQDYTIEQVTSYPFPANLVGAPKDQKIVWDFNEQGLRNVYVAEGPAYAARRLTNYQVDDGQEISGTQLSDNGQWIVYVRGGEHGGYIYDGPLNPTSDIIEKTIQIYAIPFVGGEPIFLAEGDRPTISPNSDSVVYTKGGKPYIVPVDGSAKPRLLFSDRGNVGSIAWSPDGERIAFVSSRKSHAFIGLYTFGQQELRWIDPAFHRDANPVWSPDGTQLAFVRTPGSGGKPDSILAKKIVPWEIRTASASTGEGKTVWRSPKTPEGSMSLAQRSSSLFWAADNRIVFLSYKDKWPHLYALNLKDGKEQCLTPGNFSVEQPQINANGTMLTFNVNTGKDSLDVDRRHIACVSVEKADMQVLTEGNGIEGYPTFIDGGEKIAFFSATAQRPFIPAIIPSNGSGSPKLVAEQHIPKDFPTSQLIVPKPVVFFSPDGFVVHGQLFDKEGDNEKKPAIVFVHGGPQRQMFLGWNYMDYYANNYAINQYLASQGFVVLSVNYRLGTGYGYDFHFPDKAGSYGASEYIDILTAGKWLQELPQVDPARIGIYGGSYGGFLTALALGKNSGLFKVGVDIHGVHEFKRDIPNPEEPETAPDAREAKQLVYQSSPIAYVDTWQSPVLLIHSDDDRNVLFDQTVDLIRRFEQRGFKDYEYISIPNDSHHWLLYKNITRINKATVDFLVKKLKP
ncbi:S9 family peptidase [Olivibacter sitiensis]|uniref:S9 family peptidase n=1 Tax=Olivibacter sitiensis TaxID=376470 RepID=UPI0004807BD2|nr:prolyl oligopeptidase family serine peptidase [Olivibacter sitiensis]